jgi:ABC-type Fe2+-enterobactin transport system substrate-binding protein
MAFPADFGLLDYRLPDSAIIASYPTFDAERFAIREGFIKSWRLRGDSRTLKRILGCLMIHLD